MKSDQGMRRAASRARRTGRSAVLPLLILTVAGCFSFEPGPLDEEYLRGRAVSEERDEARVSVVALGAEECRTMFDLDLAASGIQPIWLEVENLGDGHLWLFPVGIDSDYYAPHEVAYMHHGTFASSANERMDTWFESLEFRNPVPPGKVVSGFVFTHRDEFLKLINVDLVGHQRWINFTLAAPVPGLHVDSQEVDFGHLYSEQELVHVKSEDLLREELERLPATTTNEDGTVKGDPLNIVVIGRHERVFPYFLRAGWDPAEAVDLGSEWRTVKSFVFGTPYRYSPASPLYVYERHQDLAAQRARETIDQRNHLRLWLTPIRFRGEHVWIGQISRDIGVRFTRKTWNLTTHKIDPDVDEARDFLVQNLIYRGAVEKFGFAKGVGAASRTEPRANLTGDPYYTDGLRAVLFLSEDPTPLSGIGLLHWEKHFLLD